MARTNRTETFTPDEIAIVHVTNRVVRRAFLMGVNSTTGQDYSYRKLWIERLLESQAAYFAIDLICYSILSNHFHLILRSRPDVVETWSDEQIARRWLLLCPARRNRDGSPKEPSTAQINAITSDEATIKEYRSRLSDISWWMRLLSQKIAQRANQEDEMTGAFWEGRFHGVRIRDEASLLACAAYVDLNPIRAAMAETLNQSDFTSVKRRIDAHQPHNNTDQPADRFLAPFTINELSDDLGPHPSQGGFRCSDKGCLGMPLSAYIELLLWTAEQRTDPTRSRPPPAALRKIQIEPTTWNAMIDEYAAV